MSSSHRPVTVRPFRRSDQPEARRCILEGLGEHFGFIDESCNPDPDDIGEAYPAPEALFLVAESDEGMIIGTGCLLRENHDEGRIVRMSVRKSRRRRGVGGEILRTLVAAARDRGMRRLVIATEPHWEDAVGFYRRAGFVPYGSDEVDVFMELPIGVG